MNTTDYLREGYRQLQDEQFYQKIPHDITGEISDKIADTLINMRSLNLITEKNFDYLNIPNPKEARFIYYQKSTKRIFLVDQYVAQSNTQLHISANLWMNTLRNMYQRQGHMSGTLNILLADSNS